MSKKQETNDELEQSLEQDVSVESNEDFYSGFSPLDEPVKERSYTKANIDTQGLEAELEEPTFDAPNFSDFDMEDKEPSTFNPAGKFRQKGTNVCYRTNGRYRFRCLWKSTYFS